VNLSRSVGRITWVSDVPLATMSFQRVPARRLNQPCRPCVVALRMAHADLPAALGRVTGSLTRASSFLAKPFVADRLCVYADR
jgi:hypothetical protein